MTKGNAGVDDENSKKRRLYISAMFLFSMLKKDITAKKMKIGSHIFQNLQ
jgi:hypothetical protein